MSVLGLLPALGGGLRELASTGQAGRLLDGYLARYVLAFDGVRYFSYLVESLGEFTSDPALLAGVELVAPSRPMSRGRRATTLAWTEAARLRTCHVLRAFQVTGTIPAILASTRFNVPYVTTYGFSYDELSQPGPKRLLKAVVERVGLRRAAAVIVTTEALRARAARVAREVVVVPNGVDTQRFAPLPGDRPRREPARVLYVGRFSPEKNLDTIVAAAAQLARDRPLRLVLVGAGPLAVRLRAQAAVAGLDLEMPGVVPQERLPALYAEADAFVLASFTEGHPKVLLEAMAAGVPCLASNCEGNRSLVSDGVTGLLFDPRRPDALAAGLERVLADRSLAHGLAAAGRAQVVARYDLATLVGIEIALLQRVARGGVAAAPLAAAPETPIR
ncbi:MAG TPA: glycosyltransferase family 4 protein [Methylomirabilota bacterium]|nr:glycosyltransferase family 4 protein [Methylomirabilota bacterium]